MQRTITIEARRPAELHVRIRAMKTRLIDPHLIAFIRKPHRPVILQVNQIVIEGNLIDVGVHLDCFRVPQASRKREASVNAAVPRQLFQVQPAHDERIHQELFHRQLACHLIIAVQANGYFTAQPALIDFRDQTHLRVFPVGFYPAAKVSLHIRAHLEAHKAHGAVPNRRSNRPAAANVEIDPSRNRDGLSLQRGDLVQRDV